MAPKPAFDDLLTRSTGHARAGSLEEALRLALAAAGLEPSRYEGHAQAGAILALMGRPSEALERLQAAVACDAGRAEAYNNAGAALRTLGRLAEALEYFEHALALRPDYYADAAANAAGALTAIGKALARDGAIDEAADALVEAIRLAPQRGEYYRILTDLRPSSITPEHVAALEHLASAARSDDERIDVDFALAQITRQHDPQRSFDHFARANRAVRARRNYDEAETLGAFERIASVFNRAFLARHAGAGYLTQAPIFIVGMPRSGTTLIEQILAGHPMVFGAGELGLFEEIANAVLADGSAVTPDAMIAVSDAQLLEIGQRYDEAIRALAPANALRITDKMPANVRFIGLIRIALPSARIIHATRDILDTCLSCFTTSFDEGMEWSSDLGELGRYARAHVRLMNHWRCVLTPGDLLDVRYEDVVDDIEAAARRIVSHCGLPWDDRCLDFHMTKRPVRTASVAQVRRPLYRTSVGKWRAFASRLGPLIDALGDDFLK